MYFAVSYLQKTSVNLYENADVLKDGHKHGPGEVCDDHEHGPGEVCDDHEHGPGEVCDDHEHEPGEVCDEHEHEPGEVCNDEHEDDKPHNHENEENDALALTHKALKNIGIIPGEAGMLTLATQQYQKSFTFPGIVRYRPARSLISVPSPASGVVTKIFAEEGEALCPGEPLFEIQLTHEELTSCQLELLALLRKRDFLASEQDRLGRLASGIEPKMQRETELQVKENEAAIESQKQTLTLLGVTEETLNDVIIQKRNLLTTLVVRVPDQENQNSAIVLEASDIHDVHNKEHFKEVEHFQQLEKINVEKGQTVFLGSSLCIISDLRELWIEGKAFESDEARINSAYASNAKVIAIFPNSSNHQPLDVVNGLSIRSVSNRIDPISRTFACFIDLKNYLLELPESVHDHNIIAPLLNWRFKPGQRCELEIATETLENVFVVPISAVAQDGFETMLFEYIGDEEGKPVWHKRPVVVLHQTAREVVIANDGSIKVGAKIAKTGAFQLYAALTNGGGKLQSACPCGDDDH